MSPFQNKTTAAWCVAAQLGVCDVQRGVITVVMREKNVIVTI